MIDRLISVAPTAMHGAFKSPGVSAIRPVQPVVERSRQDKKVEGDADTTTYTPHARPAHHGDDHPLYSHKGAPATTSGVFAAASYEKTESLDLQVRTAEGDVVTFSFLESNSAAVSAGAVQSARGSALAYSVNASQSSDLQISVKGELSDGELSAITALAAQAGKVANDFFGGDMTAAVQDASKINIGGQGSALSAYSLHLESRETQIAAAMYENVAQTTAPTTAPENPPTNTPVIAQAAPAPLKNAESASTAPTRATGGNDLLKSLMALLDRLAGSGVTGLTPAEPQTPTAVQQA